MSEGCRTKVIKMQEKIVKIDEIPKSKRMSKTLARRLQMLNSLKKGQALAISFTNRSSAKTAYAKFYNLGYKGKIRQKIVYLYKA